MIANWNMIRIGTQARPQNGGGIWKTRLQPRGQAADVERSLRVTGGGERRKRR